MDIGTASARGDRSVYGRWPAVLSLALALVACSAGSGSDPAPPAGDGRTGSATATATATAPALEQPRVRCGAPDAEATPVSFSAADGTGLNGVLVGTGRIGVVLVHQSQPEDLCGMWPFANYLAQHGMLAFAVDLRCFGRSAYPTGEAAGRVIDDVTAAVAELRRRGATSVAVVGASMGGAAALIAGTRVRPPVAAVVSLSGEPDPTDLVGGIPLHAGAVVGQLRVPTMLVVAAGDQYVSVDQTRTMFQAIRASGKELLPLAGEFQGRHGRELLIDPAGGRFTSVATRVLAFLTAHGA